MSGPPLSLESERACVKRNLDIEAIADRFEEAIKIQKLKTEN